MHNTPLRKTVVLAVSVGLLMAAVSGGAVTYAAFTDSGNVDVTFTAGNFSDSSGDFSTTEDNNTSVSDSDGTDNETRLSDPARLSGGSWATGIPTANGLGVGRTSDVFPAAAATAVDHRRLPAAPPPLGG